MGGNKGMGKKGVLLMNIGTPDTDQPISVLKYLRQFLNDPRVIDLPSIVRWLLVHCYILPRRYRQSTRAYKAIWLSSGSPLLVHSLAVKEALGKALGPEFHVEMGMRYGQPSIQKALEQLKYCYSLTAIPLFPQYSSAATGSAIEEMNHCLLKWWNIPELYIQRDFFNHPGYIASYAKNIQESIAHQKVDCLIFSYHGLPERHIQKSHCTAICDKLHDCPEMQETNSFCYRAQSFATSHQIAKILGLTENQYRVSFQSRLGATPWIKPYTDQLLPKLIESGIKNIAVVCPSFVTDCLETLEEVNIRMREQWKSLHGNSFIFIPCLNSQPSWIQALANMIKSGQLNNSFQTIQP